MRNHKHSIMRGWVVLLLLNLPFLSAFQCGQQAGGALCHSGLCCSQWGWCGTTSDYCGNGCQSQCGGTATTPPSSPPSPPPPATPSPPSPPSPVGGDVSSIITREIFEEMLMHRNNAACPARGFYTYEAFITAARFFSGFGTTGDFNTRKRELAAFLGQTSHETTGGWATAPDGPYAWGYCFKEEIGQPGSYCVPSTQWPCAAGKSYYGRGPIQLSYNYNYGPSGQAIGQPLLENPDLVAGDVIVSFETAIWFWMTPQYDKPSCHDVMIGKWTPSDPDIAAGRFPGYGVTTNIINGGLECGRGPDARVASRIGFYERYCDILGVDYGDNLDCYTQWPFGG
ncbi:hypothetical protein Nepgr_023686 [Nepenthes gracilis]|uniref:Chitin-binding type-1 domain-containing protein n=1 Tax=Nepenthes gracilis TaxID=150966 RepID=A0AAD3T1E5_NEPGR|nr:hypothetical protein Nepgr_023686 [Nepenthes gracilis]